VSIIVAPSRAIVVPLSIPARAIALIGHCAILASEEALVKEDYVKLLFEAVLFYLKEALNAATK
jgi:hypothetical protein